MGKSSIEWTEFTWNPTRGCTKVSPGCRICYAEVFAERFRGTHGHAYEQGFDLRLVPEMLVEPFRWKEPRVIFVNSMSDLFHEGIPDTYIAKVLAVMRSADWHTYQVLTKRPDRMQEFLARAGHDTSDLRHIIWGVTVENRQHGLPRIQRLRETRAGARFLSIEPLLEDLGELDLSGMDWVIVGGESGHGARPMDPAWVRSILRQCKEQRVPFFFKQWGGARKALTGRELDGRTWDEVPFVPATSSPTRAERARRMRAFEAMMQVENASPVVPSAAGVAVQAATDERAA